MAKTWIAFLASMLLCALLVAAQTPEGAPIQKPEAVNAQKPDADTKKAEPSKDKPFAEIVKDAQVIKGLFTLYRTEEKVFMELLPEQLEKIYLVSLTMDSGLGERASMQQRWRGRRPSFFTSKAKASNA